MPATQGPPGEHVSGLRITLEVHRREPDGSLSLLRRVPTNSWVKQWVQMMRCRMQNANLSGVLDTGGASRTLSIDRRFAQCNAGVGVATFGILVGTSNVAPSRDDTNLGAQITHGTGAGQLSHEANQVRAAVAIAGGYRVTMDRQFANTSGAAITVREIGIVAQHDTTAGLIPFLILRDLVAPEEVIPDGQARVFKYHLDFLV